MTEIENTAKEVQQAQDALDAAHKKHDEAKSRAAQAPHLSDLPVNGDWSVNSTAT